MLKNVTTGFAVSLALLSVVLMGAGVGEAHSSKAASVEEWYMTAAALPSATSASLKPQTPTKWESAFVWSFAFSIVLASVFLIIWALAVSSGPMVRVKHRGQPTLDGKHHAFYEH